MWTTSQNFIQKGDERLIHQESRIKRSFIGGVTVAKWSWH